MSDEELFGAYVLGIILIGVGTAFAFGWPISLIAVGALICGTVALAGD
jgi:hypothetical protein